MNLYLLLLLISFVCLGLQYEPLAHFTAWTLPAIEHGQWWRILTGNFVHTNFAHLGMNLAALWLIGFIFKPSAKRLAVLLISISLIVGTLLLFTSLTWYVGLSGTLHGLFVSLALKEALEGRKSSWLLFFGAIAKVMWEQTFGAPEETARLIEAQVAIQAHLIGLCGGCLISMVMWWYQNHRAIK